MLTTTLDMPSPPILTDDMLARLDMPGPRYTSYPTADRFADNFGADQYAAALRGRAGAQVGGPMPLSIYIHIPFCESVCYYCACNKVITKHHERAAEYLEVLAQEVQLHLDVLGPGQPVSQIHLGGGSPTFLSDAELADLMALLQRAFLLADNAEVSIEVDPRTASADRLQHLRSIGFNRISFGIQDFDPDVQLAVHRVQPFESVRDLVAAARSVGFESINADLIYGLPKQTPASFEQTIARVASLKPDRIALYSYAHLPTRFMPQRRIEAADLPPPEHRIRMLSDSISAFLARDYVYIGMDHFARRDDSLAIAKRQGRLHRNFQGYSTQPDCDLIALGVSSIGRVGSTYSQNAKTLPEYYAAVRSGQFPIVRGLELSRDDLVRRAVIMAIMCQGRVEYESIELANLIDMRSYFAQEIADLESLRKLGLVEVERNAIQVTPTGWYFVRAVAMVFDRHLRQSQTSARFSRII
jgi:oxygen-independent coproporphyrinogen-3 oxidase